MQGEDFGEPGKMQGFLRISMNLDGPFGQFQRAIMRMVDLISFGLTAADRIELTKPPRLPDVFLQLELGRRLPLEELPTEFGIWVLGSGLRDTIEALEPFLEEVWKICWALKVQPGGPRSGAEVGAILQDFDEKHASFREFAVSKKLSRLLDEEPALLAREWKTAFFSIIGLRNCLVHRRGIVGTRDCDNNGVMIVTWQETRFLIEYEDGSMEPLVTDMVTQEAGTLIFKRSFKETRFGLGDQVLFRTQDFIDIVLTLFLGTRRMREVLLEKVKTLGIEMEPPQQAVPASDHIE